MHLLSLLFSTFEKTEGRRAHVDSGSVVTLELKKPQVPSVSKLPVLVKDEPESGDDPSQTLDLSPGWRSTTRTVGERTVPPGETAADR